MHKRKVLFVVHQLNYGGVQKALLSALDAIDYSENDVTLYVRKNRVDLIDSVNKNVSRVIVNDDNNRYDKTIYALLLQLIITIFVHMRLKNVSEKLKKQLHNYIINKQLAHEKKYFAGDCYDVAVSYIQGVPALLVASYVNAKRKVVFFHGSEDENHELHEKVFKEFDRIVGVNDGVRDLLANFYPSYADRMIYVENYVDYKTIIERSKAFEIEQQKGVFKICSCSRITEVKGFDMAIAAATILKESGIKFKWTIVGDGPCKNQIEQLINENGLSDNFEITGMRDNPYPYIRFSDIVVLSSYAEAHPLSIIEAHILNKPVVSTATIGGRTLVEDQKTGIIVDISAKSLAEGIIILINDKKLYNSIEKELKCIDYSKMKDKYIEAWEKLLEG